MRHNESRGLTYLYIFKLTDNKYKIGVSYCPYNRMQRLLSSMALLGYKEIAELYYVKTFPSRSAALAEEKVCHNMLKCFRAEYPKVGGYTEIFTGGEHIQNLVKYLQESNVVILDPLLVIKGGLSNNKRYIQELTIGLNTATGSLETELSFKRSKKALCNLLANLIYNREYLDEELVMSYTFVKGLVGKRYLGWIKEKGTTYRSLMEDIGLTEDQLLELVVEFPELHMKPFIGNERKFCLSHSKTQLLSLPSIQIEKEKREKGINMRRNRFLDDLYGD